MDLTLTPLALLAVVSMLSATSQTSPSVFHCYERMSAIGVIARRDFLDERGFIEKEIYYSNDLTSTNQSCAEDALRIHSSRTYKRDDSGRTLVETQFDRNGRLDRVWRGSRWLEVRDRSRRQGR